MCFVSTSDVSQVVNNYCVCCWFFFFDCVDEFDWFFLCFYCEYITTCITVVLGFPPVFSYLFLLCCELGLSSCFVCLFAPLLLLSLWLCFVFSVLSCCVWDQFKQFIVEVSCSWCLLFCLLLCNTFNFVSIFVLQVCLIHYFWRILSASLLLHFLFLTYRTSTKYEQTFCVSSFFGDVFFFYFFLVQSYVLIQITLQACLSISGAGNPFMSQTRVWMFFFIGIWS